MSDLNSFFKEMFDYHHLINQRLIPYLIQHKEDLTEDILKLISHSINAQEIWNSRVLDKESTTKVFEIHPLDKLLEDDKKNYQKTLEIISEKGLDYIFEYKTTKGEIYKMSVKTILYQVANHFTYHRGQIMTKLKNIGIKPMPSDYILVKRELNS